ncbi:MAG: peptidylprolyl isomerase [Oscillospiraceae bacterium]|nr:peptidylprolyl isomerase [Oscillospiraceae bacterium]
MKILSLALCLVMVTAILAGCKREPAPSEYDIDQFALPQSGEEIAVITVGGFGDIKVRFFPSEAEYAVQNFTELAKDGYYDGTKFHRVFENFIIHGGRPRDGEEKRSIFTNGAYPEVSDKLHHYAGALTMIKDQTNRQFSEFAIVHTDLSAMNKRDYNNASFEKYENMFKDAGIDYIFPAHVRDRYAQFGGTPTLDRQHTIFGQVFEGMDVLNKIAKVEVISLMPDHPDIEETTPVNDVVIESIRIVNY